VTELAEVILKARELIDRGNWTEAVNSLLEFSDNPLRVQAESDAKMGINAYYLSLLNTGQFTEAALLAWGNNLFTPEPRSVKLIWKHLTNPLEPKVIILGCGSSGKTFSTSAWADLYWTQDPQYTSGKLVSTTAGHAKSGLVSRLTNFHANSIVNPAGDIVAGGLMFPGSDKSASILQVAIPEGDTGEGRLTGFHPYPRVRPHPLFGPMSRCFVVIDEADVVPEGVWRGVDNILGNQDYSGSIKVVALTNPRQKTNPCAFRAEPIEGWGSLTEDMDEWVSREGWNVVRLDAAKSENVISKKTVFPGMMTYEGYMNYVRKGEADPSYWVYARGMYPPDSTASFNVFSLSSFNNSVGRWMFEGRITPVASIDPAFAEGGDEPILTIGTFGRAIGFTDEQRNFSEIPQTRLALQIDQQLTLRKGKTHEMGNDIIKILRSYGVRPEWVTIDKTGNGRGLYDYLTWQYGKVEGVEWGEAATETKILQEDTEPACERYRGISTEMWFACSVWLDAGFIKFSPGLDGYHKLRDELCMRRWKFFQTLQQLESKVDFKKSNMGRSCDHSDSLVMIPHAMRLHAGELPASMPTKPQPFMARQLWDDKSVIDSQIKWVTKLD
jgi:hypothetical protein